MLSALERRFGDRLRVAMERLRALCLRLRGAKLGERTRIGARGVFRRPWCLQAGKRTLFEHQVHLKATCDEARIVLGDDVFIGFNSEIDASLEVRIGNGVLIAPNCFITDHDHLHAAGRTIPEQGCVSKAVVIEDDAWLGTQVVVLPGVRIGRGAIVAAGAVVAHDVEAGSIVGGVPARPIGRRQ
jgi:acetyltransferase-like isoleucine patch superfamily enzyme